MDNSLKLQMDVRNNAEDLRNYVLDLNNWVDEMNKKDKSLNDEKPIDSNIPPPRNKIKRSKPANENNQSVKPTKISAYDYSAWDKFDVEKACAEIDKEENNEKNKEELATSEDSEENDEEISSGNEVKSDTNLSSIDEAFFEKEMGNSFVKKEQWTEAIRCYTNAIKLDPKNPVYYANRSLCFLKLKNFKSSETDATTALQLDKKYIKAYQRRAYARVALGQLAEAKADNEEILKLEPKNSLARLEINKINEKLSKENVISKPVVKPTFNHKVMFKKEESKPKITKTVQPESKKIEVKKQESTGTETNTSKTENKIKVESNKKLSNFEKGDGDKSIQNKPNVTSRVFKPLPEGCKIVHPVDIPPHRRSKKPLRRIDIVEADKKTDKAEESKTATADKKEVTVFSKLNECTITTDDRLSLDVPKSAIQFQKSWIFVRKNPEEACSYLKKISGPELPKIFENSLESDFFSELIRFLANNMEKETEVVYDFLLGLSKVKRFSSLILFMSNVDKTNVKKCISHLEKVKSQEEISELNRLYEL